MVAVTRACYSIAMRPTHLLLLACLASACGHRAAPGESVAEACTAAHHGQVVAASGYLVPPTITLGCHESCSLYLSSDRGEPEGIRLTFEVGTGPRTMNAIEMEPSFPGEIRRLESDDWILRDDAGHPVSAGDEVRVVGELWAREHEGQLDCSMHPTEVRAL